MRQKRNRNATFETSAKNTESYPNRNMIAGQMISRARSCPEITETAVRN